MGLLRQARPILDRIVQECNETAYVAIFKEGYVVYLDVVETNLTVRVVSRVGSRLPGYCTATGKVHMAYMSDEDVDLLYPANDLKVYTPTTLATKTALREELLKVFEQGYAIDNEELDNGVRCIACPIRDYTRRIVGAISISGPTMRFSDERIEKELIPLARQAADDLSTRLGYNK
jgi:DNA-binding IclR family transcriptional regulator